jgi:hypothetical protein
VTCWVTAGAGDHKKHNGDQVSVAAGYPDLFSNRKRLRAAKVVEKEFFQEKVFALALGKVGGVNS